MAYLDNGHRLAPATLSALAALCAEIQARGDGDENTLALTAHLVQQATSSPELRNDRVTLTNLGQTPHPHTLASRRLNSALTATVTALLNFETARRPETEVPSPRPAIWLQRLRIRALALAKQDEIPPLHALIASLAVSGGPPAPDAVELDDAVKRDYLDQVFLWLGARPGSSGREKGTIPHFMPPDLAQIRHP